MRTSEPGRQDGQCAPLSLAMHYPHRYHLLESNILNAHYGVIFATESSTPALPGQTANVKAFFAPVALYCTPSLSGKRGGQRNDFIVARGVS
jgi:hypothetical protein